MAQPKRSPRRRRIRRALVLLVLVLLILGVLHRLKQDAGHELSGTRAAPQGQSVISSWLPDAVPAAWSASGDRIFINRHAADGLWNGYSILPDGRDELCITCRKPLFPGVGGATNRAVSDVSPDGRYALVTVEDGSHPGAIGGAPTVPGRGVYNNIWLLTTDGRKAWRLTDLSTATKTGVIFARFDRTGTEIVWSQMYAGVSFSDPLGQWALKLARIVWHDGVPRLAGIRTYDPVPGHFYEPYEFSPDDRRILFASDIDVPSGFLSPTAFNSRIWTLDATHLDDLERISPPETLHGMFTDYNEFAEYIPGTDRILFARTFNAGARGMDYWTVNDDGTDPRRLTYMNQRGNPQYVGYAQAGFVVFDPHDPRRFVASISHDLFTTTSQTVFVTIGSGRADR